MTTATDTLLTVEQFSRRLSDGKTYELVRGRLVEMTPPRPPHGLYCGNIYWELRNFVKPRDLGRVLSNDTGFITERDPDSVRGPDVLYVSYNRWPQGPPPEDYQEAAPELVFEVRSPTDRWTDITDKIAEYLRAGVLVACILDPQTRTLFVYQPGTPAVEVAEDQDFTLPDLFGPDFRIPVRLFFAE